MSIDADEKVKFRIVFSQKQRALCIEGLISNVKISRKWEKLVIVRAK